MDSVNLKRKQSIEQSKYPGRVLVIYGPRRVGKTTLLKKYLETKKDKKVFSSTGEDLFLREMFISQERDRLLKFAREYDIIAIDEAQTIPFVGVGIKMIIDEYKEKEIYLTGSSSFELSQGVGEPLTGRHFVLNLLPFSVREMGLTDFEIERSLEDLLIFGSYPEVLKADTKKLKIRLLEELVSSYLFKDILALDKVKSPDALLSVAKALAFQIGSEVSAAEIANLVKIDIKTVQRYMDILEKMFVIKKVSGYARNERNEIGKKAKYFFLDLGVRNAIINQFNNFSNRNDVGALFENFIFCELYKKNIVGEEMTRFYFWRTFSQQEIDLVLENGSQVRAFETKYSKEKISVPSEWTEEVDNFKVKLINKRNFLDFL